MNEYNIKKLAAANIYKHTINKLIADNIYELFSSMLKDGVITIRNDTDGNVVLRSFQNIDEDQYSLNLIQDDNGKWVIYIEDK